MNDEQLKPGTPSPSSGRRIGPEVIAAAVVAIVLLIFIVQNSASVEVNWVVFNRRARLWVVILVSAVLGYAVGQLIEYGLKRRRRNR